MVSRHCRPVVVVHELLRYGLRLLWIEHTRWLSPCPFCRSILSSASGHRGRRLIYQRVVLRRIRWQLFLQPRSVSKAAHGESRGQLRLWSRRRPRERLRPKLTLRHLVLVLRLRLRLRRYRLCLSLPTRKTQYAPDLLQILTCHRLAMNIMQRRISKTSPPRLHSRYLETAGSLRR